MLVPKYMINFPKYYDYRIEHWSCLYTELSLLYFIGRHTFDMLLSTDNYLIYCFNYKVAIQTETIYLIYCGFPKVMGFFPRAL